MPRMGGTGSSGYTATATGGLVALSGSGTNEDPFKGYWWCSKDNFNDSPISCAIPLTNGWVRIKQISISHVGLAGVVFGIKSEISIAAGTPTSRVISVGGMQSTLRTNDLLVWEGLNFSLGVGKYLVPGLCYYCPLTILVDVIGYAATDDFVLIADMEWSTEEIT